jgi:hypothetical protein
MTREYQAHCAGVDPLLQVQFAASPALFLLRGRQFCDGY